MSDRLEALINSGRRNIQVTPEELEEARRRRGLIAAALCALWPTGRIYYNGSVAHGDANNPLNDIDLGIVVATAGEFGPDGHGPLTLMNMAADAIRDHLKDEFPKLTVTVKGQRRAVLVRFGDPVTAGQPDFTADVIVALDHPTEPGLYIPNTELAEQWDRADPETHTRLILAAIAATEKVFAQLVRLLKHWRDHHGDPMCSWNLKVLALECIDAPMTFLHALDVFFDTAAASIASGPTQDPAHVANPIKTNLPRREVVWKLRAARDLVRSARSHESAGRPASAQQDLHRLLHNVVPAANGNDLLKERSRTPSTASMTTVTRAWAP
jgi:hypothetical protein